MDWLKSTHETYLERTQQALIHAHHCPGIIKLAAVVWCAEKRDELTFREEFVTIFDDLVSSADQIHVMFLQEPGDNVGPEGERDAAVVFAPARDILVGV